MQFWLFSNKTGILSMGMSFGARIEIIKC